MNFFRLTTSVCKLLPHNSKISGSTYFIIGKVKSLTAIGENLCVSHDTVSRILSNCINDTKNTFKHLPTAISFDEFKSTNDCTAHMSFIYTDASTHRIIDVLNIRKQNDILAHFQRYELSIREQVKFVTTDIYLPYLMIIPLIFPNSKIIIDRFHIVQLLNRSLNRLRVEVMHQFRYTVPSIYRKFKNLWQLFLINREKLDCEEYKTHRLFTGILTQQDMVNYMIERDDKLFNAYHKINDFKYHIDMHDFDGFLEELHECRKYSYKKYVRTTFKTLEKYQEHINNSLTYTFSNGHLEGTNQKIKQLIRNGYGYRLFKHLHARILLIDSFKLKDNCLIQPDTFIEEKRNLNKNYTTYTNHFLFDFSDTHYLLKSLTLSILFIFHNTNELY